ncbi:MAG: tetratricopeptide repeat protein [Pseudomonadota bacterium]
MKIIPLALAASLAAGQALAAGSDDYASNGYGASSDFKEAASHVAAGRYDEAIPLLKRVTAKAPNDAEAYNLLGFSYRKSGALDPAGEAYRRALSLDPRHLNALEYQGELFLMLGDVAAAEANLARISDQCLFRCAQERTLEAAIAKWRMEQGG